ncbi:GOLPH3/VPS74 family protein [Streptomyces brevispora]|uniref:GPP34 family phosphoprotein n=1 Tax=Streptomyces brevispora TaxID=887462 RepID=A0ABZ1G3W4_9ACTN|nr:GPP34 family phosphoprotein [Streptomyces brevispora]WSC13948.1 GPP34 family phosphoprotein [Streptomyces brevispora]
MIPPPPGPTLPEELPLLAVDPQRGRPYCSKRFLDYAMAGAVLAELELQGRITEQRERVQVVSPLEPPDQLPATLMRGLPAPGKGGRGAGASAGGWVRHAGRQVGAMYLDALVKRGILRRETRRFLGLLPCIRHPVVAKDLAAQARHRYAVAEQAGFPDHRGRVLAALVPAADLARFVGATGSPDRTATRRLIHEQWTARAVYRNVRQDKSNQAGGGSR